MKRFILCFLLVIGLGAYAWAQTAEELTFVVEEDDELPSIDDYPTQAPEEANKNSAVDEEQIITQDKSVEQIPAETNPTNKEEAQQDLDDEDEDEEEEERNFYFALNNVESTLAAIRSVSYCSGDLLLFNDTKKDIQEISGTFGIGDQKKNFKFKNISPNITGRWPLQFSGKACESIYDQPDIQLNKCQAKDMSDKRCRSKIVFVPINQN